MTAWPVIIRELRAEARRPFNYWLRVIGVVALLAALWLALRAQDQKTQELARMTGSPGFRMSSQAPGTPPFAFFGAALFGYGNAALFAGLWILVPLLTADCLSRERREGTLGLLFLTPLSPGGVVVGKSLVHGLRALTLYATVVPLLAVPLMMGGVGVNDLQMALLLDSSALVLGLSAGLLASCLARDWIKVVILAEVFSFILALSFMHAHQHVFRWAAQGSAPAAAVVRPGFSGMWTVFGAWTPGLGFAGVEPLREGFLSWIERIFEASTNLFRDETAVGPWWGMRNTAPGGPWSLAWANYPATMHSDWFWGATALLVLSLGWLGLAGGLAASHLKNIARESGLSAKAEKIRQTWCTPRYGCGWLRWRLNLALRRNPIGWLAQHSWKARLTKWGWCFFILATETLLALDQRDFEEGHFYLAGVLLAGLALSAALGFRREIESRVLELLLVSPLTPLEIITGRVRAVWQQFLPALLVLLLAAYYGDWDKSQARGWFTPFCVAVVWVFATVPVFGVFFSLFRWNVLSSWLATCVCGLALPAVGARFELAGVDPMSALILSLLLQGAAVTIVFPWAVHLLTRRRFSLA